ncbi:putative sodium-coupled neutral amino acid transporter 6 isoform X1 [Prunus yedoensis var. nudiflora]|uniref:Putative sodium-coupled neutral amino acid transporter 6 isoform X1 n=1 Tax=Prunus yedoensis var. nudiflora TaxID=2094558 RepID=A0A314Y7Z3_PRUYE|nr:putative sodium-coupled neutral amino acid transporter 6 isoform X1 [Prunus yedoensis var. nudiflora]
MKVKAREEEKLSLTVNQQEKKTMTTDSKQTKNPRKCKQPINEESPLLPNQRGCDEQAVQEFNGASFAGAVFNLSTTIIGAGIMALPATMKVLGLGVGIGMIIFVAILTEASVEMLLRFSKVGKVVSFGGVMGDAFGKAGKVVFQLCILVNNLGTLIVYMIIIGDVLSGTSSTGVHHAGVLKGWFGEHWWNGRTFVLLVTTIFVFAPLASLKRIDSLRYTSALAVALAVVFLVITAGIVVIKFFYEGISMPRFLPNLSDIASVWNLFTVVPVLVTAFICHFNVHTIDNELEDSSLIQPIVQTSLALCSSVYILTSLFGFLLFGDSTSDDVLANFDTNLGIPYSYLLNDIVRISYALHLMLVFPVIFYPLRLNLDDLVFPSSRPLVSDNCRFALSTIGLISVVFVGANFIPSIWDVFQFSGATATVCIGFIFPAAIALRDRHRIATRKDKILSVFMIGLAVFSNVIAIYSDAIALLKQKGPRSKLPSNLP